MIFPASTTLANAIAAAESEAANDSSETPEIFASLITAYLQSGGISTGHIMCYWTTPCISSPGAFL